MRNRRSSPKLTLPSLMNESEHTEGAPNKPSDVLEQIPVDLIEISPYQPRSQMTKEELHELAQSIKSMGVLQPIIVRRVSRADGDCYELIAGERRLRATIMLGKPVISAIIREVGDQDSYLQALTENIQRSNLSPIEEARSLQGLQVQFGMSQEEIANQTGKSRSAVSNSIRLLDLEDPVLRYLEHGMMTVGHAKALLGLTGLHQIYVADAVVKQSLNVRQTEKLVLSAKNGAETRTATKQHASSESSNIETGLKEHLHLGVQLKRNSKGQGRLMIEFSSDEEFQSLLELLNYHQKS